MKQFFVLGLGIAVGLGVTSVKGASNQALVSGPLIGEIRTLAIARTNLAAISQLHRAGWVEARGELLSVRQFPELYETIGRTWTGNGVAANKFAVPDLRDSSQRSISTDNPSGVLGASDLVTGGAVLKDWARPAPRSYWIFTGRYSGVDDSTAN